MADIRFPSKGLIYLAAVLPSALVVYAAYGALTDAFPAVFLYPYKLPLSLLATLSIAATSVAQSYRK
jgi:hypothetical protein